MKSDNLKSECTLFFDPQALPNHFKLLWARIYTHVKTAIIAYENFDNGDIGFKLLPNDDFTNEYVRLQREPYVFFRSDMNNEMRVGDEHNLYMRNKNRVEDYEIQFRSSADLSTFLKLFPNRINDPTKARGYYFLPTAQEAGETSHGGPSQSG